MGQIQKEDLEEWESGGETEAWDSEGEEWEAVAGTGQKRAQNNAERKEKELSTDSKEKGKGKSEDGQLEPDTNGPPAKSMMRQPTQASQLLRDWDWEVDSIATEASKAPEFSATYPPPHTQDSYENRDRKVTMAEADKSSVPCDTVPVEEQVSMPTGIQPGFGTIKAFSPTPETEEPAGSKPSKTSRNRHGSGSTKKASKGISTALANPFKDCMEETGLKTSVGSAKVQLTLELGPEIVFQVTEGCPKWTRNVIYKAFHKNATRFAWLDVLGDKTYGAFSFNSYNLVPSDMLNYDLPAEGDVVLYKDNYSGFRFGLFFRPGARFYTPRLKIGHLTPESIETLRNLSDSGMYTYKIESVGAERTKTRASSKSSDLLPTSSTAVNRELARIETEGAAIEVTPPMSRGAQALDSLTDQQWRTLETFMLLTASQDVELAANMLACHEWNMDQAVEVFLDVNASTQ